MYKDIGLEVLYVIVGASVLAWLTSMALGVLN